MKFKRWGTSCLFFLACSSFANTLPPHTTSISGIEQEYLEPTVRPQDDFYVHQNGKWLANTEIPADKSSWGSFPQLRETTLLELHDLIKTHLNSKDAKSKQISDFYNSYMDKNEINKLGITPLAPEFRRISALDNKKQLAELIAHFNRLSISTPFDFGIHQDAKDSNRYIVDLYQGGLGLPDRDYYLKKDDKRLAEILTKYESHITTMLKLTGEKSAATDAKNIVKFETALAQIHWTKVENRDPVKTYNKFMIHDLTQIIPNYDWTAWLDASGIANKVTYLIVSQPSYFMALGKLIDSTPLATLRAYFKWHLLSSSAPFLSTPYEDENFAFYSKILNGIPKQRFRWQRAVISTESVLGELLGKLYVAHYFPSDRKEHMQELVANLLNAYKSSIQTLDWMSPKTKEAALAKLAKLKVKIGYPEKWRDYSDLAINKKDLLGNITRSAEFEYTYQLNKLGKPIDRSEWGMTPQTVNAYYNPEMNEIVFPAAILQPPFFNAKADDAVNYGGIGSVIGHEISHGFDDQGSQYDGDGNLKNWWTKADHKHFAAKTKILVDQYNAFSPISGYHVNGKLTLGENIADNSGLAIAYKAYHLSLKEKAAPVIDGLTGEQRFYMGWAQVWRSKTRDEAMIVRLKSDPHAPAAFRANGALRNQPGFYSAFDVKPGDKMYLPADKRVTIW